MGFSVLTSRYGLTYEMLEFTHLSRNGAGANWRELLQEFDFRRTTVSTILAKT